MMVLAHRAVHMPTSFSPAMHRLERLLEAVFFTVLAPVAFAILILSGLIVAMGLSSVM